MKKLVSLVTISILSSVCLFAQYQQITDAKELLEIKNELSETYKNISRIECDYSMEKSVSILGTKLTGEGKIRYNKSNPEELFWSSNAPGQSSFYMKNDSIEIVNRECTKKMLIDNHMIFKEVAQIARGSAARKSIIDENTFYADFYENSQNLLVKMTPKKTKIKSMIKAIEILMDKENKNFKEINITDGSDNLMNIKILNATVSFK